MCRAFKKRATAQSKNTEGWDPTYFYDEPSGVSSVVDPLDNYMATHQTNYINLHQSFMCKQEIEADNSNLVRSDQFVQLPQLESPSLPQMKRPTSSISLVSDNNEEEENNVIISNNKVTTDWRELDKFVASQFCQEERYGEFEEGGLRFINGGNNDDNNGGMGLVLEEGERLNGLLSSRADSCDIGICIFDK